MPRQPIPLRQLKRSRWSSPTRTSICLWWTSRGNGSAPGGGQIPTARCQRAVAPTAMASFGHWRRRPAGQVHRIDKDTSGCSCRQVRRCARRARAAVRRPCRWRTYLAVCQWASGSRSGSVSGGSAARRQPQENGGAAQQFLARKHAHALQGDQGPTAARLLLVDVALRRPTHQVRVHLASIGRALVGDPLYGRATSSLRPVLQRLGFRRQALHAAVLGFVHPVTSARLRFTSDLPPDMKELIDETAH